MHFSPWKTNDWEIKLKEIGIYVAEILYKEASVPIPEFKIISDMSTNLHYLYVMFEILI